MVKTHWRLVVMAGVVIAGLATGTVVSQKRTDDGRNQDRDGAKKDNDASLEQQIKKLQAEVTALGGRTGIQDPAEPTLVLIRGTVAGNNGHALVGAGFSVTTTPAGLLPCTVCFLFYHVTFDTPFSFTPSVVVSVHGFFPDQFVQTIAVDDNHGGTTTTGFSVYIAAPSNSPSSTGSFGSQNWDFIAVGPR